METSSTVTVSKFSLVFEFSSLLVSGGFRGGFLVSSLPVCDGGMLEFLLVFLGNYPATLFGEFFSGHRIGVIMVTGVYASIDLRVPAGVGFFIDQLP